MLLLFENDLQTVTDFLGGFVRMVKNQTAGEQKTVHQTYEKLTELQELVTKRGREGQFKYRMLDMVLGKKHPLRKTRSFTDK